MSKKPDNKSKNVNTKPNNQVKKAVNPPNKNVQQKKPAPQQKTEPSQAQKAPVPVEEPKKETIIVVKPKMTEEELKIHTAATKIQCSWRSYKAVQQLKRLKAEKKELDDKLQKLEQEAYLQAIKIEQQREEKKRLKKLKELEIKRKREARKKKFMDAAYDGNLQDLKFLISDLEKEIDSSEEKIDIGKRKQAILALIDCKDSNNNSALSEAAAGGSAEVVKFLLSNNADPNSKGAFGRTPLWRSAFAGHLNCVQILLENGGDPRIYSLDGQRVIDAATQDTVIDLLKNWNIQLTERMLQQIDKARREIKQEQIMGLEARKKQAKQECDIVNSQYDTIKNELLKCNQELQRLHDEYLLNEEMYGPLIDKKEAEKTELLVKHDDLREKSVKARIFYKDLLAEFRKEKRQIKNADEEGNNKNDDSDDNEENSDDEDDSVEKSMKINIKEIDDLILRDLSGAIKKSTDRWPVIIDQNDQASTYLRYRDTNYMNCLDMQSMKKDKFRLALLGSIRYGKPYVIDLMQYDQELIEVVKTVCDQIDQNLFDEMCNKKLIEDERFLRLVKLETDGKEYESQNFNKIRIDNFKVLFLTSNPYPSDKLLKITFPIKVIINAPKGDFDDL